MASINPAAKAAAQSKTSTYVSIIDNQFKIFLFRLAKILFGLVYCYKIEIDLYPKKYIFAFKIFTAKWIQQKS